ncbi:MAG: hypothetical protein ACI4F4_08450 [Lachnospiraceae bacterium]
MVDFIIISVFMFISIGVIIIGCISFFSTIKGCTVEVTAIVEKTEKHHSYEKNHTRTYGVLGYDYNGVHYNSRGGRITSTYQVGSRQMIKINPNNPQKHYQKKDLLIPITLLGVGGFMACLSMFYGIIILFDILF